MPVLRCSSIGQRTKRTLQPPCFLGEMPDLRDQPKLSRFVIGDERAPERGLLFLVSAILLERRLLRHSSHGYPGVLSATDPFARPRDEIVFQQQF